MDGKCACIHGVKKDKRWYQSGGGVGAEIQLNKRKYFTFSAESGFGVILIRIIPLRCLLFRIIGDRLPFETEST